MFIIGCSERFICKEKRPKRKNALPNLFRCPSHQFGFHFIIIIQNNDLVSLQNEKLILCFDFNYLVDLCLLHDIWVGRNEFCA